MTKFTDPVIEGLLYTVSFLSAVPVDAITSKSRKAELVYARAAVVYQMRALNYTWAQCASAVGLSDHSSAIHVFRLAEQAIEEAGRNQYLHNLVMEVGSKVGMGNRLFLSILEEEGMPLPKEEWEFHHTRKWRLDYCWTDYWVALEVEGGAFIYGRHNRPTGFLADKDKYNSWAMDGGIILYCTPKTLCSMATIRMIDATLASAADLHGIDYVKTRR